MKLLLLFSAKNVATEIAEQLCDSVSRKLEGKVLGTFTGNFLFSYSYCLSLSIMTERELSNVISMVLGFAIFDTYCLHKAFLFFN